MIKEVVLLRSIACLAIVLVHSIGSSLNWYPHISSEVDITTYLWEIVGKLLLFGTPTFIFISALVLSYSYPNGTPRGFLTKRLKFILVPYVIMGICYAVLACLTEGSFNTLFSKVVNNVFLGQFHGYFIIIIFQFYLLHTVFHKLVRLIKIEKLIVYSLVVNIVYLQIAKGFFDTKWSIQLWYLPLLAWIFYYSLAYYLGQNIDKFREKINKHVWIILIGSILTGALVISSLLRFGTDPPSGYRRIDILFYATCICFLLFYIGSRIKNIPSFVTIISSYSFGIYWLHLFYIKVFHKIYKMLPIEYQNLLNISGYIIILFIGSTLLSIMSVYFLNKFKFGAYVTGKIGVRYNKNQHYKSTATALSKIS